MKHGLDTLAGVIDSDFRGNVGVVLINHGNVTATIHEGQRIAQLLAVKIETPTVQVVNELSVTDQGQKGLGSTKKKSKSIEMSRPILSPENLPPPTLIAARAATASSLMTHNTITTAQIELSPDPYDNRVEITLPRRTCSHPTQGLDLEICPKRNLSWLKSCLKGTPAARNSRWRSVLRNTYVLSVNGSSMTAIDDVVEAISVAQSNNDDVRIVFGTMEKSALHPQNGKPLVYFDQLRLIGQHLHDIKDNDWWEKNETSEALDNYFAIFFPDTSSTVNTISPILPKNKSNKNKLTRQKLKQLPRDEWISW